MEIIFLIFMFVIGSCFGSFLCCQARRLHLRASTAAPKRSRKRSPHKGSSAKYSSAAKSSSTSRQYSTKLDPRSICLHCKTRLKWYDNIPIFSWLFLKGKCRHCHQKIGLLELLSELGLGLAFLCLGTTIDIFSATPLTWAIFIVTLVFTLFLGFLAIYDGKWGELPNHILTFSVICAIIILVLKEWAILSDSSFSFELIYQPLLSVSILGGIYLILYLVSKGKWVGDGDWILGLALGLAIFHPWLALLILFISNFLACLIMFPIVKKTHHYRIYFGPFLIVAFILVLTFADFFKSMI